MSKPRFSDRIVGGPPDLEIEELYAFVAIEDGKEGLIAQSMPIGPNGELMMVPFVGADWNRVKQLIPEAKRIQKERGIEIKVFKFTGKEEVTEQVFSETGN